MNIEYVHAAPARGEAPAEILDGLEIFLQPIIDVATGAVWAFEALARFGGAPVLSADEAIQSAHRAGYGHAFEAACLRAALARLAELPDGARIAMNV
jgi:predicted signal transduction protein with EAL and GGDEF domain